MNLSACFFGLSLWVLGVTLTMGVPIGELPGEDISSLPDFISTPKSELTDSVDTKSAVSATAPQTPKNVGSAGNAKSATWLAPSVSKQLSRDRNLIPIGKGAIFVPTYTEGRREPEVNVFNERGKQVASGRTGERIAVDSGSYSLKFGSGTSRQQISSLVQITEGHETLIAATWGSLLVETLDPTGNYIEGQYEVIRMDKWINYGRGHGLKEERLQDIKSWIIPPGLYRISKPGEGFNSLKNFITVQINPGELSQIELIYDKEGGDVVAGGIKALNARSKVGSNWSLGFRVGGNLNISRTTIASGARSEALQVSSDIRFKAIFDNALYLGTNEIILQDNFDKERSRPFSVTSDIAIARTNWVRRLNRWVGPYVRSTLNSQLFPGKAGQDTIFIIRNSATPGGKPDTTIQSGSRDFEVTSTLDPLVLGEGAGVNIEFFSQYYLEANTQIGFAAHQNLFFESYVPRDRKTFTPGISNYEKGIENTINAIFRLGSQATLDIRTEIFAPDGDITNFRLDDLTADFRFFLSRNLEVGYIYQVKESPYDVNYRYPSSHSLSMRLSFNY